MLKAPSDTYVIKYHSLQFLLAACTPDKALINL